MITPKDFKLYPVCVHYLDKGRGMCHYKNHYSIYLLQLLSRLKLNTFITFICKLKKKMKVVQQQDYLFVKEFIVGN